MAPKYSPSGYRPYVSVPFTRGTPLWLVERPSVGRASSRFQSPSRGGHLCGPKLTSSGSRESVGFSPLHEGDTSVAKPSLSDDLVYVRFSPLHEGDTSVAWLCRSRIHGFSPLHEGDTSVARARSRGKQFQSPSRGGHLCGSLVADGRAISRFSPLHEGDTSVAAASGAVPSRSRVSVPFTRGTPLWPRLRHLCLGYAFQSPSRGGHLCGHVLAQSIVARRFSPLHEGDTSVARILASSPESSFQSPSRGGHLCGPGSGFVKPSVTAVSVPFTRGTPLWPVRMRRSRCVRSGFSPLHEGDTSVAVASCCGRVTILRFSPLHEGDTSVAARRCLSSADLAVSVPFTRGTPLWP